MLTKVGGRGQDAGDFRSLCFCRADPGTWLAGSVMGRGQGPWHLVGTHKASFFPSPLTFWGRPASVPGAPPIPAWVWLRAPRSQWPRRMRRLPVSSRGAHGRSCERGRQGPGSSSPLLSAVPRGSPPPLHPHRPHGVRGSPSTWTPGLCFAHPVSFLLHASVLV